MAHEKSVGGVIFRKEKGEILYLFLLYERQSDDKGKHDYWDFPKGHVEKDESEDETLGREVEEETSITDINIIKGFRESIDYYFRKDGRTVKKEVIFYLCHTSEKSVKISFEHKDFAWLTFEDAMKKLTFKNTKDILGKADKFLSKKTLKDY